MQIWKYSLNLTEGAQRDFEMPEGASFLHAHRQNGAVALWFMVDPQAEKETRSFALIGTGHNVPDELAPYYLGTTHFEDLGLVLHVFETTGAAG